MTFSLPRYEQKQTLGRLDLLEIFGYDKSVITSTQSFQPKEEDELSFMKTFTFPKIEEIKKTLAQTKKYTEEQITEITEGLEDFPEYQSDKC